jgi:uncharacterized protein YbcI
MPDNARGERRGGLGAPGARISTGAVQLFRKYSGRGPSKAITGLENDLVLITLRDTLSPFEMELIAAGEKEAVLRSRHAYQKAMREELIELVEENVKRKVAAFISVEHLDPNVAFEVFLLDGSSLTRPE